MGFQLDPVVCVFATITVICLVALGVSLWLRVPGTPRQPFLHVDLGRSALYRMTVENRPAKTEAHTAPDEPDTPVHRAERRKDGSPVSGHPYENGGTGPPAPSGRERANTAG